MSSNADRPEVTAATRKNRRARKKPVMSAMRARQEPTCMSASFPLGIKFAESYAAGRARSLTWETRGSRPKRE